MQSRISAALLIVVVMPGLNDPASGQSGEIRKDPALAVYAHPDRLVKLRDGRRINVHCTGSGGSTVILTAGLGYWSYDWHRVQPAVSRVARVCSWDRAGYGHSDAPRSPVTPISSERDLEGWLLASGEKPPYILVGHSIGGIETRLFAARRPDAVAAMVLLDPAVADQNDSMKQIAPGLAKLVDNDRLLEQCERDSRSHVMNAGHRDQCDDPVPGEAPAVLASAWYRLSDRPSAFAASRSMTQGLSAAHQELVHLERPMGDKPVIVLTAGKQPSLPVALQGQMAKWRAYWRADHQRIAKLSSHGQERLIDDSSHVIEQERPDTVIAVIRSLLGS